MAIRIGKRTARATVLAACVIAAACASDAGDESTDGGTDQPGEEVEIAAENMIDDLDDGDDAIIITEERAGDWYVFNDETSGGEQTPSADGSFTPEAGGPEGSSYAAHTFGSGFTEWGAGIGFDVNNGAGDETADAGAKASVGTKGTFDASAFTGVAFMAKGNVSLRAMISVLAVVAEEEGGTCVQGATDADLCDNSHGLSFNLTDSWQQYKLPFDQVTQEEGWGQTVDFDPATIVSILFQTGPGEDFDVWVDEIGFY